LRGFEPDLSLAEGRLEIDGDDTRQPDVVAVTTFGT
jgi:hypothetical protein